MITWNAMTQMATIGSSSLPHKKRHFRLLPKIINGGIAGVIGVTCVFPIDLVKTRLQNQIVGPGGELMYKGLVDCFRKTFVKEGFFGMYSGCGVNVLLITPEKAIKLAANDFFRHHLCTGSGALPLWREMIAGAGAGFCQIVVTTPMELLKIQLQDAGRSATKDSLEAKKLSATKLTLDILKSRGLIGLYKGTGATMARDVTFSIIYFPLFAHLNSLGPRKKDGSGEAVFWHSFISGNLAGAFGSFCVTPLDVIKTRLQLIRRAKGETTYNGIVNAFVRILKEEGVTALFKGALCRMAVIAPLFGVAQMVYYIGVAEWVMGIDRALDAIH